MVLASVLSFLITIAQPDPRFEVPRNADEVIRIMLQRDEARRAALTSYVSVRRYTVDNERFHKHAEMTVRMNYMAPGGKSFEVTSGQGSKVLRNKVLNEVVKAEADAANADQENRSRIIPGNYTFELLGTSSVDGRPSFVFSITPKTENKYLMRGWIWVDREDFAIARLEGSPAKNPSFWTTEIHVIHEYEKHGAFWLPRKNVSESKVRIFGPTRLTIEYTDYQINEPVVAGDKK